MPHPQTKNSIRFLSEHLSLLSSSPPSQSLILSHTISSLIHLPSLHLKAHQANIKQMFQTVKVKRKSMRCWSYTEALITTSHDYKYSYELRHVNYFMSTVIASVIKYFFKRKNRWNSMDIALSQLTLTCSELTMDIAKQCLKSVQSWK